MNINMMLFVLLLILTISEIGAMRSRAAILGHVPILLLLTILPGTMALFRKTNVGMVRKSNTRKASTVAMLWVYFLF